MSNTDTGSPGSVNAPAVYDPITQGDQIIAAIASALRAIPFDQVDELATENAKALRALLADEERELALSADDAMDDWQPYARDELTELISDSFTGPIHENAERLAALWISLTRPYAPTFSAGEEVDFRNEARTWQLATVHSDEGGAVVLVQLPHSARILPKHRFELVSHADLDRGIVPAHLAPR